MADFYWAKLEFPAGMIDADIEAAIKLEGVPFEDPKAIGHADDCGYIADGIFILEDSRARWGQFEDLEKCLVEKGIPFDRESSGFYEIFPERRIFRPGTNGERSLDKTYLLVDGDPVVSVASIKDHWTQGTLAAFLADEFPEYRELSDYIEEEK